MGHSRLGPLPKTRKWQQVVRLIETGAAAAAVAAATLDAAARAFAAAADDPGVVESVRLLMLLPHAARADDFAAALRGRGVDVPDDPGLMAVVAAVSEAVDAKLAFGKGRTDVGELAQTAAAETLAGVEAGRPAALFEADPDDVRRGFAGLATVARFGRFARDFFARFVFKTLDSYLSRALPDHVGEGKRFRTLAQHRVFVDALDTHCREAAVIVEQFAGKWLSKHHYETGGELDRRLVARFVGHAMTKLSGELRRGTTPNG